MDRERVYGEHDEACNECNIARWKCETLKDDLKDAKRSITWLTEDAKILKTKLDSAKVSATYTRERELIRQKEAEGKYLYLAHFAFSPEPVSDFALSLDLKVKVPEMEAGLMAAEVALDAEQREHTNLRSAVSMMCVALGAARE